ncbi:MAG: 7-cyano-7-deazaguanine synthase QueC [Prevotellaceae bacterium]|nr:7-cyano-7-deazaguanine synthase QueC [Prevotellaceae bacterium]
MKDSVIVLSGGMDSVTMLHEYKERIALALTFDYGSNHGAREIAMARRNCELLGVEIMVIPLHPVFRNVHSSLLEGAQAIPEGHYAEENMKSTVVPFRNGVMLSVACAIAEDRGLKHVMIANHGGDHSIYPDCRPDFVSAMGRAMTEGTYAGVSVLAPYTDITKADIARHGKALGVDYALTWSCYKGGAKHCGKCGTCVERREAMREAGIQDPTDYEAEETC